VEVVARELNRDEEVLSDDVENGPAEGGAVGAAARDGLLDVLEDALEVVKLPPCRAELRPRRGRDLVYVPPKGLGQQFAQKGTYHCVIYAVVMLDERSDLSRIKLKY
jgi:hypothetical protein